MGGVGESVGVPVGIFVLVGVGDSEGVNVMRGVRVGRFVGVRVAVLVGVKDGGRTRVGVIRASTGYSSCIAEYQVRPWVKANSEKRAPP